MIGLRDGRAAVLGDINLDIIAFHPRFPREGGEELAERAFIRHGGSGANIAHTLSLLGVDTLLMGCVGADPVGVMLVDGLAAAGVDTSYIQRVEGEPSGLVYIIVSGRGERTMLAYRGANKYLRYKGPPKDISILHISGYGLLEGEQRSTALKLLESRGDYLMTLDMCIPLAMNTEFLENLVGRLDCLFINSHEFRELTLHSGIMKISELASKLGCLVVLKKGESGCEISTADGDVVEVQALPVEAVDTTGAGDAFTAGFIYELMKGAPPKKCGERAVRLGALASTTIGGRIERLDDS
jgi:ribokinase